MSNLSDAPFPQTHSLRRSATLPSKLNPRPRRQSESLKPSENDLFYHPSAKVVHFAPRALAPIPSSTSPSDFDYPVDTVETLPWRSPTERTVALGPLRLQNVHGLTVFLKCGNVVHAILKNSQCWCVDGESTFVLRIRPLTYYRIELPTETENDKVLVVGMKTVLPGVLRYEVTPCPFKRGFTVEIPEEAKAPRRKRAWRPKGRRDSAPITSTYHQGELKLKEDLAKVPPSAGEDTDGDATDDSGFTTKDSNSTILETIPDDDESPELFQTFEPVDLPGRSAQETEQNFQTLLARFEENSEQQVDPETSFSSSVESFHSLGPSFSTLPDLDACSTPTSTEGTEQFQTELGNNPSPSEEQPFRETERSRDRLSVYVDCWDDLSSTSQDLSRDFSPEREAKPIPNVIPDIQQPALTRNGATTATDSNPNLSSMSVEFRRRSKASREREVSPMPPASSLALTRPEKHDAASLIQKTCTLVLVPPIQLLVVLIHVAARIVIGPALNSAIGELNRKIEYGVTGSQDTVDDFDLPLPDRSRASSADEDTKN
ncbi:uncharacterized protein BO80DRAFT_395555 [Aspergillus ibericus CBS 121593]|uniref:Inheritance of peroxisomes protein 1 n=1 Tax=Aspergillus ibericus CBS 121593 TaxID=1448316 RepID=A0A395HGK1_9EURO|nr:hypothetical protein BO80DRAFT_395555 [Aspergillus ibericus CBS 121593]RAL06108.1 hypothetical protein BO80DRAFT_395555 [Aspergillus ibericus CBS 121593]